jgi:hypothetical protein
MKTYLFPLVPAMVVSALLSVSAIAAPALAPIITDTDHPNLAPIEGTFGQTDTEQPNVASPTGSVKNMAPTRGKPSNSELKGIEPASSASGLTVPGASSGSSLGSGSNSTLGSTPEPAEKSDLQPYFED